MQTKQFHRLRLNIWQRRLLIGVVVSITSQLYLDVWVHGFRVSAAAIIYPILLVVMMRSSHWPDAGLATGIVVVAVRAAADAAAGAAFWDAVVYEAPGGVFYFCYDALLCLMIRDRRSAGHLQLGFVFVICDLVSNVLDLGLSGGISADIGFGFLAPLALLALARGGGAAVFLWVMLYYHQLLLRQEHERRYQRLFVMTAELKNELYFLKKDSEDIEGVMSRAYRLYERLGELGIPEEDQALALSIAREVHEIKKDNLRIIRGIESEMDDVYDEEEIHLSDLFQILKDTTQRMMGEQRMNIRLECRQFGDLKLRAHYRVLSVLKNLVTNAVEAIQGGKGRGTVWATATVMDDEVILEVSDDGPGMSKRALENLFQVGYSTKFDPDTGNINRGVGLPAVKFIVDELGGSIDVTSQPGKGARFAVRLPIEAVQGGQNENLHH